LVDEATVAREEAVLLEAAPRRVISAEVMPRLARLGVDVAVGPDDLCVAPIEDLDVAAETRLVRYAIVGKSARGTAVEIFFDQHVCEREVGRVVIGSMSASFMSAFTACGSIAPSSSRSP
jgi:hypothetical protein